MPKNIVFMLEDESFKVEVIKVDDCLRRFDENLLNRGT